MRIRIICIIALITSCTNGIEFKSIKYDDLLCDGNSKIWLIDKMIVDKVSVGPYHAVDKELMIFYNSGRIDVITMKYLGERLPKTGNYVVDSDEKILYMYFTGEVHKFGMKEIADDSVYLVPFKESQEGISLRIIPFPEL